MIPSLLYSTSSMFFSENLSLKTLLLGVPEWLSWLNVQLLVSAQVMISQFVGSSPTSSSALTVWSPLWVLCSPLSLLLPLSHCLSLSKINIYKKRIFQVEGSNKAKNRRQDACHGQGTARSLGLKHNERGAAQERGVQGDGALSHQATQAFPLHEIESHCRV